MIGFLCADGSPFTGDLFGPLTGDANAEGVVEHRRLLIANMSGRRLIGGTVWAEKSDGGAEVMIGLDPAPAAPIDSITGDGEPDSFVTFHAVSSRADGLPMDTLPSGTARVLWVRRRGVNSEPVEADTVRLHVAGDVL